MRIVLRWMLPDLLTSKLSRLSVEQSHEIAQRMGIYEGLHEWLHGFCPCEIDMDLGDDDVATA